MIQRAGLSIRLAPDVKLRHFEGLEVRKNPHRKERVRGQPASVVQFFPRLHCAFVDRSDRVEEFLRESTFVLELAEEKSFFHGPVAEAAQHPVHRLVSPIPDSDHLTRIRAREAHERGRTGRGVRVAVMDSGVSPSKFLPVKGGFSSAGADYRVDRHGHGTRCAGLIAARETGLGVIGVAPEAELFSIAVGDGNVFAERDVVAGLAWALDSKMDVVSMSLWEQPTGDRNAPSRPVEEAARRLEEAGGLVLAATGNSGKGQGVGFSNHFVTSPALCRSVCAVGGMEGDHRWLDSSYGPPDLEVSQAVEVVAPSTRIDSLSNEPGHVSRGLSGVSFATPIAAGVAALLAQEHASRSADELRALLRQSAVSLESDRPAIETGFGCVDCVRAVELGS